MVKKKTQGCWSLTVRTNTQSSFSGVWLFLNQICGVPMGLQVENRHHWESSHTCKGRWHKRLWQLWWWRFSTWRPIGAPQVWLRKNQTPKNELWVFVHTVKDQQACVLFHHIGTSTQWYSSGCVGGDIYRFLPASALQPEGPCEMFDAVLVSIFVCCPSVSNYPVPVLSLSSTNFVSIVTLSPCTTSDEQWSEKLY